MEKQMIFEKMASILADVGPVEKLQTNDFQKYKFRGIDQVYEAINTAMAKHCVFCVPEIINCVSEERTSGQNKISITRLLTIKYTFYAADGSSVCATVQGEASDTSDKASNKAMAAAHKYALTQCFVVPYKGMDEGDKDHIEHTSKAKKETPAAYEAPPDFWKSSVKQLLLDSKRKSSEANTIAQQFVGKSLDKCNEQDFATIYDILKRHVDGSKNEQNI